MSQSHREFSPLDPGRINAMDPVEFDYWCRQLECSAEQLSRAVGQVGEHVTAVRLVLETRRIRREPKHG